MVVPGWVAAALVIVNVWRPCTPSVPLLDNCIAPPWVMATADKKKINPAFKTLIHSLTYSIKPRYGRVLILAKSFEPLHTPKSNTWLQCT